MSYSDPLLQALALLKPRWPRLLLAVTCGVLSLGSALALAGVSAWLITRAWEMPPILDLSVAVVAVRAFGISRGVLHYCERLATHDTALRAAGTAREQIYRRLAEGPSENVVALPRGELVGRVGTDVDDLADVLVRAVLPIAVAAVLSVAAVTVIAIISPGAAAVLALCLLIAGVAAPWLSARATIAQQEAARTELAARDVAAMTALDHAAELRIAGRLSGLIEESAARQRNWALAVDRAAVPAAVAAAMPTAAIGASVLGAVIAGIGIASSVAPTTVAILMLLPLSSFEATTALPAAAMQLTKSRIAARRLFEMTGPERDPHGEPGPQQPAGGPADLTLEAAVLAGYPGTASGVEFEAQLLPGTRLAVLGASGSGKSSLLMTLAGLIEPLNGQVSIGGRRLDELPDTEVRQRIGYFAEDAHVFDTTVRDNLLVVRGDCGDDELTEALSRVGLGDWLSSQSAGLSTVLSGGAAALSAGQRRRLLLARVLLSRAPVILLDEPTEHLDEADSDAVLRELLSPAAGLIGPERTVVVATHHLPADTDVKVIGLAGRTPVPVRIRR